jgi:hypothetical protein
MNCPQSRLYQFGPRTEKIIVVGDLHGYFEGYEAAVDRWRSQKGAYLLFLGDYADRGPDGVEIIEALKSLTREERVIALKGNHEDYSAEGDPLFQPCTLISEAERKRGNWKTYFVNTLKPFFDQLYLAALSPGRALFVHGGISSRIESIENLKRPSRQIEEDILWSDPIAASGERLNPRGRGMEFGPDITGLVLDRVKVLQIVRGHQPPLAKSGPAYAHERRIVTLSTTDVYNGKPFLLEVKNQPEGAHFSVIFVPQNDRGTGQ